MTSELFILRLRFELFCFDIWHVTNADYLLTYLNVHTCTSNQTVYDVPTTP